jgi:hypothetical protein
VSSPGDPSIIAVTIFTADQGDLIRGFAIRDTIT